MSSVVTQLPFAQRKREPLFCRFVRLACLRPWIWGFAVFISDFSDGNNLGKGRLCSAGMAGRADWHVLVITPVCRRSFKRLAFWGYTAMGRQFNRSLKRSDSSGLGEWSKTCRTWSFLDANRRQELKKILIKYCIKYPRGIAANSTKPAGRCV